MNLLPKEKKDILKKGLKLRFLTVLLHVSTVAFLIGLIMLLPAYFLVSSHLDALALEAGNESETGKNAEQDILGLPAELNGKLQFFQSNTADEGVTGSLSKIIGLLPVGVRLDNISFTRRLSDTGSGKAILISGISADRDSLLKFGNALKESREFASVEVPVSSFTKERNLDFSINISIAN